MTGRDPGDEVLAAGAFVRSYVITDGRELPPSDQLTLHTLVIIAPDRKPPRGASPELLAIWDLCSDGYLSVAEVAAHVGLPTSITRLLLTDLQQQGHLLRRGAPPRAPQTDRALLRKVLDGLQARHG